MAINPKIVTEIELHRLVPYVSYIRDACATSGGCVDPYDLAAVGYRESGFSFGSGYEPRGDPFGYGDQKHGNFLYQIDDRSYPARIEEIRRILEDAGAVAALRRLHESAVSILIEKRAYLCSSQRPQPLAGEVLRRAMLAAYNAGEKRIYPRAIEALLNPRKDGTPEWALLDSRTTGEDYSTWVVARAEALRKAAPALFD